VKIFPALLDSRPAYFDDPAGRASLLLAPMGTGTLLCELHARIAPACREAISVIPTFDPSPHYEQAVRNACSLVGEVTPMREFVTQFSSFDLTDWLLIADPACFALEPLDWAVITAELTRHQHGTLHVVSLDANPGGTTERVQLDRAGRVRRIQRYYDTHTWAFTRGIVCSFVPASALMTSGCTEFSDLRELRQELARRGVPSRDLPLSGPALDLTHERSLLWLSERCIAASEKDGSVLRPAAGAAIDPAARLIGSVVVQRGAIVEAGAQVIGPAVVGADARIGRDAIVAQCLIAPGGWVAPESVIRHRALAGPGVVEPDDDFSDPPDPAADLAAAEAAPRRRLYPHVKLAIDVTAAAVGLVLLSPLLAIVAVLIKLESPGPVFYGDFRETIGGRVFRCWKFRTMYQGAASKQRELLKKNELDGPQFKMRKDPRVTPLGGWLRKCSLDEFPQLFNVVRGEMSLVGPRPSPFRENQICVPWREGRLSVRAGITGLWQVCREARSAGDFHQWILYDLLYVQHMSALVDLRILLATVLTGGGMTRVPVTWVIPASRHDREPKARTSAARAVCDTI
jgi:lipopolysaccharide/colanic/teichoic acid biosynthesis glycosyltransferase